MQEFRKKLFWAADKLKGSPVRTHLNEVESVLEGSSSAFTADHTEKRERELFYYATAHTDFYSSFNNVNSLGEFPVVNKNIIRENPEAFISDAFSVEERIPAITSGSTGTPFKVYHSQNKKYRNTADTLYFAQKAGYEIGNRLIYLKIWVEQKMASPVHYLMQNVWPVDVIKLTNSEISTVISKMEKRRKRYSILGYVSALERICKFLEQTDKERVDADVASIITMSESLTPYVKDKMEHYFGTEVYSRYSNLENGILAQQLPGSKGRFLINRASYIIEILKLDDDLSAQMGEPGRIVVTDLFSDAMPLLRYDTGDIGVLSEESDEFGNQYLDKIEGRKLDILYDTTGNIVSSYLMYKNMWQYTEIKQYQLIQEDEKEYTFKININGDFDRENQLVEEYKSILGQDANFKVEYVDEIPLLSSGKRKKTVNNWKN